jgi:Mn2+/Fe2+ NRAMP family transporter
MTRTSIDVDNQDTREAPKSASGIFRQLGPGLIIAASIVGSGELIATTITGAKAGVVLLWLIILGCVIKVFTQIEIGRFTLIGGLPTLSSMDQVPGPRIAGRGNWLVWYWFFMWMCSIGQLGGIVGGVGQTMTLIMPITQQGRDYQEMSKVRSMIEVDKSLKTDPAKIETSRAQLAQLMEQYQSKYPGLPGTEWSSLAKPYDDRIWAVPVTIVTSILLILGRYSTVQTVATIFVAIFTMVTVGTVVRLEFMPEWRITSAELIHGLSFQFPKVEGSVAMAFAAMGIIGVGAAELIQYPYWCLEKGYARWTGAYDGSPEWFARARGWMRVMRWDAWASMVIYTLATIAFYLLGVAILYKTGLVPEENQLIQTLAIMYEPVFSSWAVPVFLLGAFAVLYSTFFVANASHALTFTDGLAVIGAIENEPTTRRRMIKILCGLFPFLCLIVYCFFPQPILLVMISGMAQALMLPMLFAAAVYFRYKRCFPELKPGALWDTGFWLSGIVLLMIGLGSLWINFNKLMAFLGVS